MKRSTFLASLLAIPLAIKELCAEKAINTRSAIGRHNPFKVHRTTDPFPTTIVGKEEFDYPMHLAQVDNNLPCYSDADCPPGYICKRNGNRGEGIVVKDPNYNSTWQ